MNFDVTMYHQGMLRSKVTTLLMQLSFYSSNLFFQFQTFASEYEGLRFPLPVSSVNEHFAAAGHWMTVSGRWSCILFLDF